MPAMTDLIQIALMPSLFLNKDAVSLFLLCHGSYSISIHRDLLLPLPLQGSTPHICLLQADGFPSGLESLVSALKYMTNPIMPLVE